MDSFVKAFSDVLALLIGIGYNPIPTAASISVIFIGRERFVRPLRSKDLTPAAGLELYYKYKGRITYVAWLFAFLTAFAVKKPDDLYEVVLVLMWSVIHLAVGTLVYDHLASRGFVYFTGEFVRKVEDRTIIKEDRKNG